MTQMLRALHRSTAWLNRNPRPNRASNLSFPNCLAQLLSTSLASVPIKSAGCLCFSRRRRASLLYSPRLNSLTERSPRPATSGAVSSRMACVFDVSGVVIRQSLRSKPEPEDTPARCHLRAKDKLRPPWSISNPPYHPQVKPRQLEHGLGFSTSHPHSGPVDCCSPFAFVPDGRLFSPAPDKMADSKPPRDCGQSLAPGWRDGAMGCRQPNLVRVVVPSFAPWRHRLRPIDRQIVHPVIFLAAPTNPSRHRPTCRALVRVEPAGRERF